MNDIFKKTAKQFKVSEADVKKEISEAIKIGISDPDSTVQQKWREIPHKGDKPTPEELILWICSQIGK